MVAESALPTIEEIARAISLRYGENPDEVVEFERPDGSRGSWPMWRWRVNVAAAARDFIAGRLAERSP